MQVIFFDIDNFFPQPRLNPADRRPWLVLVVGRGACGWARPVVHLARSANVPARKETRNAAREPPVKARTVSVPRPPDTDHSVFVGQALARNPTDPERFARTLAWRLRLWWLCLPAGIKILNDVGHPVSPSRHSLADLRR